MTTLSSRYPERRRLGDDFVPRGRYVDPEFLALTVHNAHRIAGGVLFGEP